MNGNSLPIRFGPYDLFSFIGKGGMAEIFLGRQRTDAGPPRLTVIKRILPHLNADRAFCEMLINEAKICANLEHANVVSTYQLGQIDQQYFISMEYVDGVDLNRLMGWLSRESVRLPLPFALYIVLEVLKGLDYAHRVPVSYQTGTGIIHRDVSPANVLVSAEGEVKLCDFGIARVAQEDIDDGAHHVDEEHVKGKVAYMAPEHFSGQSIDHRADLYAAGILLWELSNGQRLFKSSTPQETLRKVKASIVPDFPDHGYPEYEMLIAIVKKALSVDPDNRFPDGKCFIRAIEDYAYITEQRVSSLQFQAFLQDNLHERFAEQQQQRQQALDSLDVTPGDMSPENRDFVNSLDRRLQPDTDDDEWAGLSRTRIGDALAAKFAAEENKASVDVKAARRKRFWQRLLPKK